MGRIGGGSKGVEEAQASAAAACQPASPELVVPRHAIGVFGRGVAGEDGLGLVHASEGAEVSAGHVT